MSEIFEGLLKAGRNRAQVKEQAEKVETLHDGKIALSVGRSVCSPVHGALFQDHNVRFIIFSDGYNLGVLRHPSEKTKLSDERINKLIAEVGESSEWCLSPAGGLLQRGTPDQRKFAHSRVNKHKLADTLATLLETRNNAIAQDRSEV